MTTDPGEVELNGWRLARQLVVKFWTGMRADPQPLPVLYLSCANVTAHTSVAKTHSITERGLIGGTPESVGADLPLTLEHPAGWPLTIAGALGVALYVGTPAEATDLAVLLLEPRRMAGAGAWPWARRTPASSGYRMWRRTRPSDRTPFRIASPSQAQNGV